MRTSIVRCVLSLCSGEGAAHENRLHLPAGLCDHRLAWHAQCVAWAPSPPALLAHLHASGLSWAQDLGREGQVDPGDHDCVALWTPAQGNLWERASDRQMVGSGSRDDFAPPMACCSSLETEVTPTHAAPKIPERRKGGTVNIIPGFLACASSC